MKLGENILRLRKNSKLSQEMLAEKIGVTRQTISNWELGETSPNPEQLKLLSKTLDVSVDELLDNDIKEVLVEKVSNTEKLAGMIIKILKGIGIIFVVLFVIDVVTLILFTYVRNNKGGVDVNVAQEVELQCVVDAEDYIIVVGSDGYFSCSNCSMELQKELKDNYIDFTDIEKTMNNLVDYFENNNGICE